MNNQQNKPIITARTSALNRIPFEILTSQMIQPQDLKSLSSTNKANKLLVLDPMNEY